ncbi:hypothetical protein [Enterococcus faecium]|uniref:hypothetical protein n=1 Tax=Enterococcus faecium TaxID=1352 RepID=UPI002202F83D|nr:hypothetical protein EfmJHP9_27820 [Enterococcus faecium]
MDFNKKFFWEISDLSCFVESERLSNGNNSVLNEYTENLSKTIEQIKIDNLLSQNYDPEIYLFLYENKILEYVKNGDIRNLVLIHDEFMDYQKLDQLIERESWEDYYVGLTFSEKLNNYKLIDYKYLSESN